MAEQSMLLPIPDGGDAGERQSAERTSGRAPRLKEPNRLQLIMDTLDVDKLIAADHLARGIWALVESLPTEGFLADNKSVEGHAGRPRTSPKMLLAIWVYSYSQGMGQAREIESAMQHEPALRWLAGNSVVSFRTLSEFRIAHGNALRDVFAELLGILDKEQWIDLNELTLDGTKIKANASGSSQRREKTLHEHIANAAKVVGELEQSEAAAEISKRHTAAKQRAAQERQERLKKASSELAGIRESKKQQEREQARVSLTDPEARVMKDGNGGFALSYNVQVLAETKNKIVVDVAVTQQANDQQQLEPALERRGKHTPRTLLIDGGYATASNIDAAAARGVELIGPELDTTKQQQQNRERSLQRAGIAKEFGPSAFVQIEDGKALRCPAGKRMKLQSSNRRSWRYLSLKSDCANCEHQAQCSPKGQRLVKVQRTTNAVEAYRKKMNESAYKERYKKRGEVAEFPHAWWKQKLGLRTFHVRGKEKVEIEAWWAALTYNIQQWVRLSWKPTLAAA